MQFTANGNAQKTGHCVGTVAGGDGIASAGATSGESIKRKNGETFRVRNAAFVPQTGLYNN